MMNLAGSPSLSDRRWGRRLTLYYKIVNGETPAYLFDHVPSEAPRALRKFIPKAPITRTQRYANSFFPYCINHWEALDGDIKYSTSVQKFKDNINDQIRPEPSFCCNRNKHGMKLLTQIRVDFLTSVTTGLTINSTVQVPYVPVVSTMKPRVIFFCAALATKTFVRHISARYLK